MKKYFILLVCLTVSIIAFGQSETRDVMVNIGEVEVAPPQFTGIENVADMAKPDKSLLIKKYLIANATYPENALLCNKEGSEIIKFVVTPKGNLTNFEVINSVCSEIDEEVIRILKTTNGMWQPGLNNGEPVAMEKEVSVVFCANKSSFETVCEHFTKKATANFISGNKKLYFKQNPKRALKYYDIAVRYLPNDESALYNRGMCRYELGDKEGAFRDWNRIVSLGGINVTDIASEAHDMQGYAEANRILKK